MRQKDLYNQSGQALIMIIVMTVIGTMVVSASVMLSMVNNVAADKVYQGTNAIDIAESGAETAMIKLLRNPSYSGETLPVGDGQAVITLSGTNPIIIVSEGIRGNFRRKVQVIVDTSNNRMIISSWKEI